MHRALRFLILAALMPVIWLTGVTAAAAQSGGEYVVQRGDDLHRIAQRLGISVSCLAETNNLPNLNLIHPGLVLVTAPCYAQVAAQPQPDVPQPSAGDYLVQPGDRLTDLAVRFGADLRCLIRVNMLADQNLIRRGQSLLIAPCTPQAGGSIAPPPVNQSYTIQRGDRLMNIAFTFGVDADCLAQSNDLADPNVLRPGQTLIINFSQCAPAVQTETPAARG